MELQVKEKATVASQNIKLVKGEFTPEEAFDVVNCLIKEKINFHKMQRLQLFEGILQGDEVQLNGRIAELKEEQEVLKAFVSKAQAKGMNIKVKGNLELSLEQ